MNKSLYDWCIEAREDTLLRQWCNEKNGERSPKNISYNSHYKAWWQCETGHQWQASLYSRVNKLAGCPYCSGKLVVKGVNDLATLRPDIASQWHPRLNGDISPSSIAIFSNKYVWWLCEKGHEWKTLVSHRVRDHGCPYCTNRKILKGFNDLATVYPKVAAQWHPTLNGDITPEMVAPKSKKSYWFICPLGHVWKTRVYVRTSMGSGCPVCAGKVREKS